MQEYDKQQYIDILTEQIRSKRARAMVAEEIKQHLEDQEAEYIGEGMTVEAAAAEAVRQMGDPVEVGLKLDRIHRPKTDWKLLAAVGIVTLAGLLVQYMVAGSLDVQWFSRQLLCTEIGVAAMIAVYFADYTLIGRYPFLLWGGFTGFLFVGIILSGSGFGISLFPQIHGQLRIYPLLILLIPLFVGVVYRFRGNGYMGLLLCQGAAAAGLVPAYMAPNRTAMAELLVIFTAILVLAVYRGWFAIRKSRGYLMILSPIAAALLILVLGSGFLAAKGGYAFVRMDAALHPEKYADSFGYMAMQIRNLLEQLSWFGGAAKDVAAVSFIRETGMLSDLLYTYVLATYGIFAGILLMVLLGGIIARMFSLAFRQKNQLGFMLSFGCACLFLAQTAVYVIINMGYMFFSPMYLPFFSFSGTGTISLYILLGLILSVYRNTNLVKEASGQKRKLPRYRLRLERIS